MEYKGYQIPDTEWNTRHEDYKNLGNNDFDMDAEDLQQFLTDLEAKRKELAEKGIVFRDLRYNFYVTECHESDYDYRDDPAKCIVTFEYVTGETTEERAERVQLEKNRIDEEIRQKEVRQQYEKEKNEREIRHAISVLENHGYEIKDIRRRK